MRSIIKDFLSERHSIKFWNMVIMLPFSFLSLAAIRQLVYIYIYCYGYGAPLFTAGELFDYSYVNQVYGISLSVYNAAGGVWVMSYLCMVILLMIPYMLVVFHGGRRNYWIYLHPFHWVMVLCDYIFDIVVGLVIGFNSRLDGKV